MRPITAPLALIAAIAATPAAAQTYGEPSPLWATVVSAGTTAAGAGLLATYESAGMMAWSALLLGGVSATIGPSAGFFYIGERGRGAISLGIRTAALVVFVRSASHDEGGSDTLLWSSAAVFGASALYDIATVGRAARARSGLNVDVDPRTQTVRVGATIGF